MRGANYEIIPSPICEKPSDTAIPPGTARGRVSVAVGVGVGVTVGTRAEV